MQVQTVACRRVRAHRAPDDVGALHVRGVRAAGRAPHDGLSQRRGREALPGVQEMAQLSN